MAGHRRVSTCNCKGLGFGPQDVHRGRVVKAVDSDLLVLSVNVGFARIGSNFVDVDLYFLIFYIHA